MTEKMLMLTALNIARARESTLFEGKSILQCLSQWSQYSEMKENVITFFKYPFFLAQIFSIKSPRTGAPCQCHYLADSKSQRLLQNFSFP